MVANDPTFGCGDFLPGYGPFNFYDGFEPGGGSIDGGGGDDDDDDDDDGGGGDGGDDDEVCRCYTTVIYDHGEGYPPDGGDGSSDWNRSYWVWIDQECRMEPSTNSAGNGTPDDYRDLLPHVGGFWQWS